MHATLMLEKMMFGFIESQVLFVCDELRLFDFLIEYGPSNCQQISERLNLPASSLERLLICATSMGLLEKIHGLYKLKEEFSPYLQKKSPVYWGAKFSHYWKMSYKLFEYLKPAIEENSPQWNKLQDNHGSDALDYVYLKAIYSNDTSTKEFLATMWASGFNDSLELCRKFSFNGYKKLVDLGGATGSFAIAALQNNPGLETVIMDYSSVKPYALEKFNEYHCQDRAQFIEGDMFNDVLPPGDIYAIGYVLSDWPEKLCKVLIQKVYNALPEGGMIVILEKFFNEDKTGPYLTAMLNITMLLEMHGQHHNAEEYISWLKVSGFKDTQVIYSSGEKHMVVGKKPK